MMRIPLHNGPFAKEFIEVEGPEPANRKLLFVFAEKPIFKGEPLGKLKAHAYTLQSLRGSQTVWAYVYTGIMDYIPAVVEQKRGDASARAEVSAIVSTEGAVNEASRGSRGHRAQVTAGVED